MQFRNRSTGDLLTERQVRMLFPQKGLPENLTQAVVGPLGIDRVVLVPSPEVNQYQTAIFEIQEVEGVWTQVWSVGWIPTEHIRTRLKEALSQKKKEVEAQGVLVNGVLVNTEVSDQNRISSAIVNAERAGIEVVDFEGANGWTTMTLADLNAVANAIALHVQACFSAKRAHSEAIDLLTTNEELAAYDITTGWPE